MGYGMEQFRWKGKLIKDIDKFCKDHNTKMIKYKGEREVPSMFSGKMVKEVQEGEMPEMFFDNLRMTNGWYYNKL